MPWVRTHHDGERWKWRSATEAEIEAAKQAGTAVHLMFGEQPSEYDALDRIGGGSSN